MKCIQLSLVLAVATLAAAAALAPTAQATFRCNGSADLCDRPFNEVVFPSTHNSMAADNYGWSSLVTTQTWSIRDQLRLGIRALAIDVWYAREGGAIDIGYGDVDNDVAGPTRPGVEPYLCHGQCQLGSKRLEDGFAEVLSFLQESPREVVLIYVEDYVSPEDMKTVVEDSGLWPYVHTGPQTATLRQLIDSGKRLVFVSQNKTTGGDWYPYLRNIGRDTGYAFDDTDDFTTPAGQVASCAPNPDNTTGSGRLFVMQHFITDPIASRADSQVVNQPDVIVTRALRCRDVRGVMPSVLMVDYNELGDVNRAARMLNDMYVDPEPSPGGGSDGGGSGAGTGAATPVVAATPRRAPRSWRCSPFRRAPTGCGAAAPGRSPSGSSTRVTLLPPSRLTCWPATTVASGCRGRFSFGFPLTALPSGPSPSARAVARPGSSTSPRAWTGSSRG